MTTFLGIPTAPRGVGHLRGDEPFPVAARKALANTQLRRNLGKATKTVRFSNTESSAKANIHTPTLGYHQRQIGRAHV